MFQFAFDKSLFEFTQPTPAFAPLFRLPPTSEKQKKRAGRSYSPLGKRYLFFFLESQAPIHPRPKPLRGLD